MIEIRTVLMEAETNNNGIIITEMACQEIVKKYKETSQKIIVRLDNVPAALGEVKELIYDEDKKQLIGVLSLRIDFASGGKILKSLETPQGNRVLDCSVNAIVAKITPTKLTE